MTTTCHICESRGPRYRGEFDAEESYRRGDIVAEGRRYFRSVDCQRSGLLPPSLVVIDRPRERWVEVWAGSALGLIVAQHLYAHELLTWLDRQLRRWPWLYRRLEGKA